MSTQFPTFAFPATGEPTNRTLPGRLADTKNVRDFGATGDGITDDWAAIMAAFNWTANPNRGTIFFPPGTYLVSQPIDFFGGGQVNACFVGVLGASTVIGNFADYIFKRALNDTVGYSGCHTVENLTVVNTNPAGGGIRIGVCVGGAVRNCVITANQALNTCNDDNRPDGASLEISIENCTLSPGLNQSGSMGIRSVADGPILNCAMTGFDIGMRLFGQQGGMSVKGCRFELCGIGIVNAAGLISGCFFKNCGIAFQGGSNVIATGLRIEGATGTIAGDPQYGFRISANAINHSVFAGIVVTGQFRQYGIYFEGGESFTQFATLIGVQSTNSAGLGAWRLPTTAGSVQLIGCNVAPVFTMLGLPAFPSPIKSLSCLAGTTTLTQSIINLSPYVNPAVTLAGAVVGASPSGYNGAFSGAAATGVLTMTYTQADPGSPTGSGGTVVINPSVNTLANTLEGDCYNVSDSDASAWGANPTSGGGTIHAKVRWNGRNWTVVGK